MEVKKPY